MDSKFNREKDNLKSLSGEPFMPMSHSPLKPLAGHPPQRPTTHSARPAVSGRCWLGSAGPSPRPRPKRVGR